MRGRIEKQPFTTASFLNAETVASLLLRAPLRFFAVLEKFQLCFIMAVIMTVLHLIPEKEEIIIK